MAGTAIAPRWYTKTLPVARTRPMPLLTKADYSGPAGGWGRLGWGWGRAGSVRVSRRADDRCSPSECRLRWCAQRS